MSAAIFSCCLLLLFVVGPTVHANWLLTWSDEFNNQVQLDSTKWNTFYPFEATINNELEYYTADSFSFASTYMSIVERKRNVKTFGYTSGVITSRHKFSQTYGYFEMRAQVPQGLGFWPAFWLLPEQGLPGVPAEIDVMEMIMNLPTSVFTHYHCNYSTGGSSGFQYTNASFGTGYHTFGLQWLVGQLIWYVDGVKVFAYTGNCVPNRPEYLLANVAIGGSWPTPPNSQTPFPSYMNIDYIRAYKYVSSGGGSLAGPGAGISFTPTIDVNPAFALTNPVASPQTAAPGSTITLSVTIVANTPSAMSNMNIQFPIANYSGAITTLTVGGVNFAAGTSSSVTVSTPYTIPASHPTGYLKIGVGIFSSSWSNLYWEGNTIGVGVNSKPGTLGYIGCFVDAASRDLPTQASSSSSQNVISCLTQCQNLGYSFAGLQNGNECWCGNSYGKYGKSAADTDCNMVCAGNSYQKCGAGNRNSVFKV